MRTRQHGGWRVWSMAVWLCAPSPLIAGEIRIWPSASVEGPVVTLSHVAEIRGFDLPSTQRLSVVQVAQSPTAGREAKLSFDDIRSALAAANINLADVQLVGSAHCKVVAPRSSSPAAHVDARPSAKPDRKSPVSKRAAAQERKAAGATLESALREFIIARTGEDASKIEIRFAPTARRDLALDAAEHQFQIQTHDDSKIGLVTLEVTISSRQGEPRTVPVVAEVSLVREVVVARRVINRGETLEPANLKLEQRRFTDYAQVGMTDLSSAVGQQARQIVRIGEMLTERSLESRPVVRRGDAVTIWMRQGGMVIKAGGRAQASGAIGDRIEVARDGAKRKQDMIETVVTGPATVAVGEEGRVALAGGQP